MDKKSEYELQHFGFSVNQIALERNYVLQKFLNNNLNSLAGKLTTSPTTQQLLAQEVAKVQEQIWHSFGEQLHALQDLDAELFSIPSHVLLVPDLELARGYTAHDEQRIDGELDAAKKLFHENSVMIATLKTENALYDTASAHLHDELKYCKATQQTIKCLNLDSLCELLDVTKQCVNAAAAAAATKRE